MKTLIISYINVLSLSLVCTSALGGIFDTEKNVLSCHLYFEMDKKQGGLEYANERLYECRKERESAIGQRERISKRRLEVKEMLDKIMPIKKQN